MESNHNRNDDLGLSLRKVGVVLQKGLSGAWDDDMVESPSIIRDPRSGRWAMVYAGYGTVSGVQRAQIGLAFSNDKVHWTKEVSPLLTHSGISDAADEEGCTGPLLLWDGDNDRYVLYYIGLTAPGYEGGTKRLCVATTPSLTSPSWTRHGAVILPSGSGWHSVAIWHPCIAKRDSTYYCFFNASGADEKERIGYATASNILGPWTVDDVNSPLISGVASTWEDTNVGDPCVRRIGDLWLMDYFGFNGTSASNGVAATPDSDFPLGWTKHPNNPILEPSENYDSKFAHKPFILVAGGQVLHYYTAVDTNDERTIALAVSRPVGEEEGESQVVFDDFNRANGSLGATSSGHTWATTGAGFAVANNKLAWSGAADAIAYVDSGLDDDTAIELTVTEVNGTYPLSFIPKFVSSSQYLKFYRNNALGKWILNIDGSSSTSISSPNPVAGDKLRLESRDSTHILKRNGVTEATWVTLAHSGTTKQGLAGSANTVLKADNFAVVDLAENG